MSRSWPSGRWDSSFAKEFSITRIWHNQNVTMTAVECRACRCCRPNFLVGRIYPQNKDIHSFRVGHERRHPHKSFRGRLWDFFPLLFSSYLGWCSSRRILSELLSQTGATMTAISRHKRSGARLSLLFFWGIKKPKKKNKITSFDLCSAKSPAFH